MCKESFWISSTTTFSIFKKYTVLINTVSFSKDAVLPAEYICMTNLTWKSEDVTSADSQRPPCYLYKLHFSNVVTTFAMPEYTLAYLAILYSL